MACTAAAAWPPTAVTAAQSPPAGWNLAATYAAVAGSNAGPSDRTTAAGVPLVASGPAASGDHGLRLGSAGGVAAHVSPLRLGDQDTGQVAVGSGDAAETGRRRGDGWRRGRGVRGTDGARHHSQAARRDQERKTGRQRYSCHGNVEPLYSFPVTERNSTALGYMRA